MRISSKTNWLDGGYWQWVFYPIAAYALSWIIGFVYFMYIVFPVLLTAAQYQVLRKHEAARDAKVWFVVVSAYLLCVPVLPHMIPFLSKLAPFINDEEVAVLPAFVALYYGCQICSEAWMSLVFNRWRYGYYALGNVIAWLSWCSTYAVLLDARDPLFRHTSQDSSNVAFFWVLLVIPLPSLLANFITGYFLHLALKPIDEA